jgi:4-amino-4-deoxy-L-arabinose transferase-like glycosyltransferase
MKHRLAFAVIALLYLAFFLPAIGSVYLFDWDEINFAEAAREMVVSGDWLNVTINFEPFWEKPPLFIWLQAISFSFLGISEFAARLPNVIIGFFTLLVLYRATELRYSGKAALTAVLLYLGSFTSQLYFKTGIIDPLFNLFIFLSILYLVKAIESRRSNYFFVAGVFIGLAILTKGPVVLLLVGLTGLVYQIVFRNNFYGIKDLGLLLVGIVLLPALYFGVMINQSGWWFLREFIVYQIELFSEPVASHGQPFYYHAVVLLLGFFPALALSYKALYKPIKFSGDRTLFRFAVVLFWVVLVVFSSVTTKIVHYSSLCYLPVALVGGVHLSKKTKGRFLNPLVYAVGVVWMIVFVAFGLLSIEKFQVLEGVQHMVKPDMVTKAQLQTSVKFSPIPFIVVGIGLISAFIIHKQVKNNTLQWSLVFTSLAFHVFLWSVTPPIENMLQKQWVKHLKTYQGTEMAHFTLGFKSYATQYYTQQSSFESLALAKQEILKRMKKNDFYELSREDKKYFTTFLRDFVVRETNLPVSVSVKLNREGDMQYYPELDKVFEGNGYCVYERK